MSMSGGREDGEPMMERNTAPVIDVMRGLLIMFIITIPVQTHAVKVDLPQNDPNALQNPIEPDKNKISIDPAGVVAWNGAPVDDVTLRQSLDPTTTMTPEPELPFQPARNARDATVDGGRALIKRPGVTKLGFTGKEQS